MSEKALHGRDLRVAASLLALMTVLLGLAYPVVVATVARLAFPAAAEGSLVRRGGAVVGSSLIGQSFSSARYVWGRPSATTPGPYDPTASGGSNLGPSNPALVRAVRERIAVLKAADPDNREPVPVDLVTASASGLDPDISPAAAYYQAARVARARGRSVEEIRAVVARQTRTRSLGFLGEPRVNVLELNLALDALR
jgi:K+-transporting ATPase ATPase C chain